MTEGLEVYLDRIRSAASDAVRFVRGMDRAEFLADDRTQQAVAMSLFVIGEAANRIAQQYPEFVRGRPDIAWNEMRGMRNRIAHGYFEIDFEVVWLTVKMDLPELVRSLASRS